MNEKLIIKDIAIKSNRKFSFKFKNKSNDVDAAKELDSNDFALNQPMQESVVVKEEGKEDGLITIEYDINRLDDGDWDIISN